MSGLNWTTAVVIIFTTCIVSARLVRLWRAKELGFTVLVPPVQVPAYLFIIGFLIFLILENVLPSYLTRKDQGDLVSIVILIAPVIFFTKTVWQAYRSIVAYSKTRLYIFPIFGWSRSCDFKELVLTSVKIASDDYTAFDRNGRSFKFWRELSNSRDLESRIANAKNRASQ